jgi:hypothetical protein
MRVMHRTAFDDLRKLNSFISPQTSQHNDKNYIDGEKGQTELVSSSLKLIAREIGKRRQFFATSESGHFMTCGNIFALMHGLLHLLRDIKKEG